MKCPNCGYFIRQGVVCPNCGVDAFIFRKTRNTSIRLYNKGLEQAKSRDLTGAIKSLEQSILFDKNNYIARNLLGLVYHEKGQIADALKQWIVSAYIEHKNNPASRYMDILQKDGRKMEKKNDAVQFYNQAIAYLQQGSDDLALIQLKRALDYNSNFVEACNLMTLCCLQEKNFNRASYFVQKVLKIDQYNPIALHYARELDIATNKKSAKNNTDSNAVKRTDAAPPAPTYRKQIRQNNFKNEIISFLIGGVSVAIVLLSLVMPALSEQKDKTIDDLRSKVSSATANGNITPEELTELRERAEKLEKENEKYKKEAEKQQNITLLQEASALAENSNFVDAAAKIILIDASNFSEEESATLDTLKSSVLPEATSILYTQGRNEFLNKNYDVAKENLENCLKYASSEDFIDDAFYYLGQIAQEKNDVTAAIEYYQRIIEKYPDSNNVANAQNALEQLNATATPETEPQPEENTEQNTN